VWELNTAARIGNRKASFIVTAVQQRVAMSICEHKTRSIFDRYNIVSEVDLREATRRTQDYLTASAEQRERPAVILQPGRIQ
jgi:hypothetical protein